MRVLVYVICYNAENFITSVLQRIPLQYRNDPNVAILIVDDYSTDRTSEVALAACEALGYPNASIWKGTKNQQYGGIQKVGYFVALKDHFDYVILLHGDGQYAPEMLPTFFELFNERPDVVLGSRMINKANALKGGMPLLRFIANIFLTGIQNLLANSHFSEFHTGYRAYSRSFLESIPFELNSDYFDFDTDILLQAHKANKNIIEFPISTYYGTQISYVNLIRYGLCVLKTSFIFRIACFGITLNQKYSKQDTPHQNSHFQNLTEVLKTYIHVK